MEFIYDPAGNVLNDGTYSYTWNAEGQMVTANGVTYTYDVDGKRVKKSSGTFYWGGLAGGADIQTRCLRRGESA